jgi:hypothetical protein
MLSTGYSLPLPKVSAKSLKHRVGGKKSLQNIPAQRVRYQNIGK